MLEYLLEVRRRSVYVLVSFCLIFVLLYLCGSQLLLFVLNPLLGSVDVGGNLISTTVTGPVLVQIKIAFDFALVLIFPLLFYQAWRFAYPALHQYESQGILKLFLYSLFLFFCGIAFAYFLVLPCIFKFLFNAIPSVVTLFPDINYTLDFITRMLLVFGICFQLPLITSVLIKIRIFTIATLKDYRPYFIVFAFIIGMIFTPPDVFSQFMLALPMVFLYEVSIFCAKKFV